MAKEEGITVKKSENFSEWYSQVIQKSELAEYSAVSGCIVFRPYAYQLWENIQKLLDIEFKKTGVKNAYFPLLIPESLLKKESEHVEGFTPEVAWVTEAGDTKLSERLAIRPTSETIMYHHYKNWIRSWRDLPLKINQWCNVVRWEFKNPVPFLRTREFLWQEGHNVFATEKETQENTLLMLEIYEKILKDIYAIPTLKGKKSEKEKFAGAVYTLSLETLFPNGKSIQCCTSHNLGQNFSKPFEITFLDKDEKKQFAWQNSWGFTTRTIGILVSIHGDDKGLVIPPNLAPNKIVIIPIYKQEDKDQVLKKAKELVKSLKYEAILDDREEYTPGWKYNHWELKGVPIRIEIGPRDIKEKQVVVVRRDTNKKEFVKLTNLNKTIETTLEDIQSNLFNNAKKFLESGISKVKTWNEFVKSIENKKIVYAPWCGDEICEEKLKDKSGGAKSLTIPFDQKEIKEKCILCDKKAKYYAYFGKSY